MNSEELQQKIIERMTCGLDDKAAKCMLENFVRAIFKIQREIILQEERDDGLQLFDVTLQTFAKAEKTLMDTVAQIYDRVLEGGIDEKSEDIIALLDAMYEQLKEIKGGVPVGN